MQEHPLEPISGSVSERTPEVLPPTKPDIRFSTSPVAPTGPVKVDMTSRLLTPPKIERPNLAPPINVAALNKELGRSDKQLAPPINVAALNKELGRINQHPLEPVQKSTRPAPSPSLPAPMLQVVNRLDSPLSAPAGSGMGRMPRISPANDVADAISGLASAISGRGDAGASKGGGLRRQPAYDPFIHPTLS